jgi:hypothetical protein
MQKYNQQGATLIVVLILLLVITLLGTLAIRQGVFSLNIATNSQAQSLLIQSSDTVLYAMEKAEELDRNMSAAGMFGFIKPEAYLGKELVFCYRPLVNPRLFDLRKASLVYWPEEGGVADGSVGTATVNNTDLGIEGFCQISSTSKDYTSNRKAVLTQVSATRSATPSVIPFQFTPRGTDAESAKVDNVQPIKVMVTSIIPGLSTASDTKINNCFKNHTSETVAGKGTELTVTDCLAKENVPLSTQNMDYALLQYVIRTKG